LAAERRRAPVKRNKGKTGKRLRSHQCDEAPALWPLQDILLLRGFCARINHSFTPPAHLHCPPWCNTIARLLGSILHDLGSAHVACVLTCETCAAGSASQRLGSRASTSACEKRNRSHTQQHDKNNTTNQQPHERAPPPRVKNNTGARANNTLHVSRVKPLRHLPATFRHLGVTRNHSQLPPHICMVSLG